MKKFFKYLFLSIIIIELFGAVSALMGIQLTGFRQYVSDEWKDPANIYADRDSIVGVWHQPNDEWYQMGPCFSVPMKANRYGARDNEWDTTKTGNLFLGSSFVEGFAIQDGKRMTDIFERLTNKEAFTCGMSGEFSPVQYYMTLRKFENILNFDTCFVFLYLPKDEDFTHKVDSTRYRPYLSDTGIFYTRSTERFPETKTAETKMNLFLLQYSYIHHLIEYFKHRNFLKSKVMSSESDAGPKDYPYVKKVISLFSQNYPQKQFYFVIFPNLSYIPGDFSDIDLKNVSIIDISDVLTKKNDYLECNLHWNEAGHLKVATELHKRVYGLD